MKENIKKAFLALSYDNGGIHRTRSEQEMLREAEHFLSTRSEDLTAIDEWLGTLSEKDFYDALTGEIHDMERVLFRAPPGTEDLLNWFFQEIA